MTKLRKALSISQVILAILREAGEGTIKSFFPHPYSHLFCNHKQQSSFHPAVTRLKKAHLIAQRKNGIFYLTLKGEKEAFFSYLNAEASSYTQKEKPRWDGKWRIIFFDIPEKKREQRDYLRSLIKTIGFREFQKSVWVYPYKVPDFLPEILREENIHPYTRFLTSEEIDYDHDLKKLFHL